MTGVYYNEFDRHAAGWLRQLARDGLIPEGWIHEQDIKKVRGSDVEDFHQQHYFAGIGGWALALDLAGWPDDEPIWTGSCPCQPYSVAGKGRGDDDPRNLWPEFRRLIAECRPSRVVGEQVSRKSGHRWFAGVRDDLEALGYAVGAADLPACCAQAPHLRHRIYWAAALGDAHRPGQQTRPTQPVAGQTRPRVPMQSSAWDDFEVVRFKDGTRRRVGTGIQPLVDGVPGRVGALAGYGNAIVPQVGAVFVTAFAESIGVRLNR